MFRLPQGLYYLIDLPDLINLPDLIDLTDLIGLRDPTDLLI